MLLTFVLIDGSTVDIEGGNFGAPQEDDSCRKAIACAWRDTVWAVEVVRAIAKARYLASPNGPVVEIPAKTFIYPYGLSPGEYTSWQRVF